MSDIFNQFGLSKPKEDNLSLLNSNHALQILEAIIRSHGGALAIHESVSKGLSGELVHKVSYSNNETYDVIVTRDRYLGRWNPTSELPPPITKGKLKRYAKLILDNSVTTIDTEVLHSVIPNRERAFHQWVMDTFIPAIVDEMKLLTKAQEEEEALREEQEKKLEDMSRQKPTAGRRRIIHRGVEDVEGEEDDDEEEEEYEEEESFDSED